MRRNQPMTRTKRLKTKRATPRRSGRVRDPEYMDAVRGLPCYGCSLLGYSEADHQGPRPFGRKADDETCVPMCSVWGNGCHAMRTDGIVNGSDDVLVWFAKRLTKEEMRDWCDVAIAATQAVVFPMLGRAPRSTP